MAEIHGNHSDDMDGAASVNDINFHKFSEETLAEIRGSPSDDMDDATSVNYVKRCQQNSENNYSYKEQVYTV